MTGATIEENNRVGELFVCIMFDPRQPEANPSRTVAYWADRPPNLPGVQTCQPKSLHLTAIRRQRLLINLNGHTLLTQRCFGPTLRYMADAKKKKKRGRKAVMVGLGLDSDGHKRVTTGPNFALVGGSKETHEEMTEKVIKINEKLNAAGKRLENVSRQEFDDIAHAVGLKGDKPE